LNLLHIRHKEKTHQVEAKPIDLVLFGIQHHGIGDQLPIIWCSERCPAATSGELIAIGVDPVVVAARPYRAPSSGPPNRVSVIEDHVLNNTQTGMVQPWTISRYSRTRLSGLSA